MVPVDWLAVLAASVVSFMIGALWYSPVLFLKPWLAATGNEKMDGHPPTVYLVSAIMTFLSVYALAVLIGPGRSPLFAAHVGVLTGALIVAASIGINNRFAMESAAKWGIDGGFHIVRLGVAGAVYAWIAGLTG